MFGQGSQEPGIGVLLCAMTVKLRFKTTAYKSVLSCCTNSYSARISRSGRRHYCSSCFRTGPIHYLLRSSTSARNSSGLRRLTSYQADTPSEFLPQFSLSLPILYCAISGIRTSKSSYSARRLELVYCLWHRPSAFPYPHGKATHHGNAFCFQPCPLSRSLRRYSFLRAIREFARGLAQGFLCLIALFGWNSQVRTTPFQITSPDPSGQRLLSLQFWCGDGT
jgi:hypothetical protein